MATIEALRRHRMITAALTKEPVAIPEATLALWDSLAAELTQIIGDRGFQSLYARSVYLANKSFPWLTPVLPAQETGVRFGILKANLIAQCATDATQAGRASADLLTTFIDILAVLIGEALTTGILRSAWGGDVMDIAEKELPQ